MYSADLFRIRVSVATLADCTILPRRAIGGRIDYFMDMIATLLLYVLSGSDSSNKYYWCKVSN